MSASTVFLMLRTIQSKLRGVTGYHPSQGMERASQATCSTSRRWFNAAGLIVPKSGPGAAGIRGHEGLKESAMLVCLLIQHWHTRWTREVRAFRRTMSKEGRAGRSEDFPWVWLRRRQWRFSRMTSPHYFIPNYDTRFISKTVGPPVLRQNHDRVVLQSSRCRTPDMHIFKRRAV